MSEAEPLVERMKSLALAPSASAPPASAASASAASASAPSASAPSASAAATGPVTEEEIRAVLMEKKQVTTQALVSRFRARLRFQEDKAAFAVILRRISKLQKNANSQNFVVLRA